jgi:sporulation protein YlmC with PRC-barrel domain
MPGVSATPVSFGVLIMRTSLHSGALFGLCVLLGVMFLPLAASAVFADSPPQPTVDAAPKPDDGGAKDQKAANPQPAAPAPDTPAVVVDDSNVESLLGKDILSASKGEKLGQITDVLVGHGGDIRAAVIDFGGFLGVGSRKIAVAWPTLKFSKSGIVLNMTRDEVRVTPEYHAGEPIVIVGSTAPTGSPSTESNPAPATAK